MKPNLVWFDIPATDLARAMRFYSAVLGRELKEENLGGVPTAMLPTADGGQQGCVVVVKDFKPSADGCAFDRGVWVPCGGAGFGGELHRAACGGGG